MSDTWNKIDVEHFPKNLSSENESLRSQLAFVLHEKSEVERLYWVAKNDIERLKTGLADTRRVHGNATATNEQKFVAPEQRNAALEGAIREALVLLKIDCKDCRHMSPDKSTCGVNLCCVTDDVEEILRKAVE